MIEIGTSQVLCSPWDLAFNSKQPNTLWVAMAGNHQIWTYNETEGSAESVSGTGQELHLNNNIKIKNAAWAQPSGLSFCPNGKLYVADTEVILGRRINFLLEQCNKND